MKAFLPVVVSLAIATLNLAFPADKMQLAGVANFRDIGGYKTGEGRKIKSHVIYRSGELSGLTPSDQRALAALQIRYEIDLRTDKEREGAPSRWGEHAPAVFALSVGEPRNSDPSKGADSAGLRTPEDAGRYLSQATVQIAIDGAPEIGEVMRRLAQGGEPALIHCTAGKDRTGVTVAVLMTLLGAPRDEVNREYMLSAASARQQIERMKARDASATPSGFLALRPEVLRTLLGAKPEYMEAMFHAIDQRYGSFDAYAQKGLKISPDEIQALRAMLLEP
jgi:protein-tyrosine phosphatase